MEGVGKRGPATTWGRTVGSREGPLMERVHDGLVESTEPAAPHDLHLANMATLIDQQSHHDTVPSRATVRVSVRRFDSRSMWASSANSSILILRASVQGGGSRVESLPRGSSVRHPVAILFNIIVIQIINNVTYNYRAIARASEK